MKVNASVIAHPVDGAVWVAECSECGPLSIVGSGVVDEFCSDHLATHSEVLA